MIGIVTSKTRQLYTRPPDGPFTINWGSKQAIGLVNWWPLNDRAKESNLSKEMLRGQHLTYGGTTATWVSGTTLGGYSPTLNGASLEYWRAAAAPVSVVPISLTAWGLPVDLTARHPLLTV